jgi:hypothetical protein
MWEKAGVGARYDDIKEKSVPPTFYSLYAPIPPTLFKCVVDCIISNPTSIRGDSFTWRDTKGTA